MPIEIKMPALSPTMTEGNLARWLKQEGDQVAPGDVIAEIETDKATMEVEAVDEGTLGKILVDAGTEGVQVNAPIALLLEEGEDAGALASYGKGDGAGAKPAAAAAPPAAPAAPPAVAATQPAARPDASHAPTAAPAARGNGHDQAARIFASPLAKRMAEQAGIDLARLQGSGPHGRIVKADIEQAMREGVPAAAPAAAAAPVQAPAPAPSAPAAAPSGAYDEVPLTNMRKVIARRLAEAKQTIPHFYLSMDITLDPLLALRKQLNEREGAEQKLSVNDFVIKAAALALRKVPDANAAWGGDKIYRFREVDISVAVAIPDGLITPIIRRADQKSLGAISREMQDLAARAKDGKLKPEEFQGGGFSISNLGMFGVSEFAAVINPPQACILAVGAGRQLPVVKDGALAIGTVMTCTLSVDHRAVDGALGARWLQAFKAYVEDPLGLLI